MHPASEPELPILRPGHDPGLSLSIVVARRCNAKYLYRSGGCGHAFVDHSKLSEKVKGAARLTVLDATP
jgi:hypothetical protein